MGVVIAGLAVLIGMTYFKKWGYLWTEWLTSVDHKHIGVMYIILAAGHAAARLRRRHHDARPAGHGRGRRAGYLPPDHYDQIFTAHGVIMIFFVAMPFMVGLMNVVVPLQIGARDVAFPFVNSLSFWLTVAGAMLVNALAGASASSPRTGWLAYPPLSELAVQPGRRRRLLHLGAADLRPGHDC